MTLTNYVFPSFAFNVHRFWFWKHHTEPMMVLQRWTNYVYSAAILSCSKMNAWPHTQCASQLCISIVLRPDNLSTREKESAASHKSIDAKGLFGVILPVSVNRKEERGLPHTPSHWVDEIMLPPKRVQILRKVWATRKMWKMWRRYSVAEISWENRLRCVGLSAATSPDM